MLGNKEEKVLPVKNEEYSVELQGETHEWTPKQPEELPHRASSSQAHGHNRRSASPLAWTASEDGKTRCSSFLRARTAVGVGQLDVFFTRNESELTRDGSIDYTSLPSTRRLGLKTTNNNPCVSDMLTNRGQGGESSYHCNHSDPCFNDSTKLQMSGHSPLLKALQGCESAIERRTMNTRLDDWMKPEMSASNMFGYAPDVQSQEEYNYPDRYFPIVDKSSAHGFSADAPGYTVSVNDVKDHSDTEPPSYSAHGRATGPTGARPKFLVRGDCISWHDRSLETDTFDDNVDYGAHSTFNEEQHLQRSDGEELGMFMHTNPLHVTQHDDGQWALHGHAIDGGIDEETMSGDGWDEVEETCEHFGASLDEASIPLDFWRPNRLY